MAGDTFQVGDLVRFAIRSETNEIPWSVNDEMTSLYDDVFIVNDITEPSSYDDLVKQRIEIGVCAETRNPDVARKNLHWAFNEHMFTLATKLSINFSYDEAICFA